MIPQTDPKANYLAHQIEIDAAITRVLQRGQYILGEETHAFEQEFAAYIGQTYGVGVANGTDALALALRACGVDSNSEVITVAHTAVATIAAICMTGATPVCVDIDPPTYTLDVGQLASALSPRTKAIVPVHLYGMPADMRAILQFAHDHDLWVIEDCAQAHGARLHDKKVGAWGHLSAFSFYPTKNLGAIGDGGIVLCSDPTLYAHLKAVRQYGWDDQRRSQLSWVNSRLDELQAAILRVKLSFLEVDNAKRRALAAQYSALLQDTDLGLPAAVPSAEAVFHQYVIRHPARTALRQFLTEHAISTAIHYAIPAHLQPGYQALVRCVGALPATEQAADSILSLPMYPELSANQLAEVAEVIHQWCAR